MSNSKINRKELMVEFHKRAKKAYDNYLKGIEWLRKPLKIKVKTYAQILGEEMSSYWRTIKIVNETKKMSIVDMELFCSNYKSIK